MNNILHKLFAHFYNFYKGLWYLTVLLYLSFLIDFNNSNRPYFPSTYWNTLVEVTGKFWLQFVTVKADLVLYMWIVCSRRHFNPSLISSWRRFPVCALGFLHFKPQSWYLPQLQRITFSSTSIRSHEPYRGIGRYFNMHHIYLKFVWFPSWVAFTFMLYWIIV